MFFLAEAHGQLKVKKIGVGSSRAAPRKHFINDLAHFAPSRLIEKIRVELRLGGATAVVVPNRNQARAFYFFATRK
jgi:hypothetical protein